MQKHPEYSSTRNSNQVVFETGAFSMMHKLRLLQLTYIELNGSYEEFPTSLRWLCWHKFLKGSIPSDFSLKNLVVLEMCYSSMRQVWTGTKVCYSSHYVIISLFFLGFSMISCTLVTIEFYLVSIF